MPLAGLIVSAAIARTAPDIVVVSVSGASDGVARTGLGPESFVVQQLGHAPGSAPLHLPVAQVVEGPGGVYTLTLAYGSDVTGSIPIAEILSIAVSGTTETGWADDRGQTLAVAAG